MGPGQPGHVYLGPGQHPGDEGCIIIIVSSSSLLSASLSPTCDDDDGDEVGEDVDGLVVPVQQAGHAAHRVQGGTVVGVDIPEGRGV